MSCRRWKVSGRVQGVFYRGSTQREAKRLGLNGSAINLPDGTVEVVACGADASLDAMEQWLWKGPEWASVSDVAAEALEQECPSGFVTG